MSLVFDKLQTFFTFQTFLLQAGKSDLQTAFLILKVCTVHAEFFAYYPQKQQVF